MAASLSTSSDDQFEIGSVLDHRYRIEAVLGSGGMGRVYRAEHTKIGKSVAIKVLHADLTRNREASQRFRREVIALGKLDHPNIVGVSDSGQLENGACFLVMEVLEGESLGDRLAREHRIHWVEALDILRGMLFGLRHAHERGVVHRDVKPDNIYLAHKDGEPVIKILDFGIAKLFAGHTDDPASTRAGLTVGTPAYLSPEQAVGGEISPASDLYSASIVLYEMLAGRAPFEDKDPLAMLGAHVSRPPPRFAVIAPGVDVPPQLEGIIQHGLRKTAAERISTANEYLALIDAFSPPLHPYPRSATAPVEALAESSAPTVRPEGPATPLPAAPAPSSPATSSPATPLPAAALPAPQLSVEMAQLPRAVRAVSLGEIGEPIPLTWIVRSGVVIGLGIIAAIALAIGAHCRGSEPSAKSSSSTTDEPAGAKAGATARPAAAPAKTDSKAEPDGKAEPDRPDKPDKPEPATKPAPGGKPESGKDEPAAKPEPAPRPAAATRPSTARPASTKGKAGAGSGSAKKSPSGGH